MKESEQFFCLACGSRYVSAECGKGFYWRTSLQGMQAAMMAERTSVVKSCVDCGFEWVTAEDGWKMWMTIKEGDIPHLAQTPSGCLLVANSEKVS